MKKILLSTALVFAVGVTAQDYEWQWAKRGGGLKASANESASAYAFDSEQIIDIAVDSENNYYYLAFITQSNTKFEETPIIVYNPDNLSIGYTDVVLFSTDCEGNLRWTQAIGGGGQDYAHKIVLDNNGGLYLGANFLNISGPSPNTYLPPHFSPTEALPVLADNTEEPQEGYKTAALLKYNTNDGSLVWRVMPQGDVTSALRYAHINQVAIDSEGTIHTLIGLTAGIHLGGQVVVPDNFTSTYRYHIVKFDADGEVLNVLPLSLEGVQIEHFTIFRYDEALQRYYMTGIRSYGSEASPMLPLSFNGVPFAEQVYILAMTNTGAEVWRREIATVSDLGSTTFNDFEIDDDSSLYLAGKFMSDFDNPGVSMGSYQFPSTIIGHIPFVMKVSSAGQVQWMRIPSGYTEGADPNFISAIHYAYDLTINGDEMAIATQVADEIWGTISVNRPDNHYSDPALLRLNKSTGEIIALHEIMTTAGARDGLTAVTVDNDGNYVIGGYFFKDLFTLEDDNVPTVTKVGGVQDFTDFFVAKLAASECGTTAGIEEHGYNNVKVYPNPTTGLVNIQAQEELRSYEVVNLLGQVLLKGEMIKGQTSLQIEGLAAGTFILNITTAEGKVISRKVVKQ